MAGMLSVRMSAGPNTVAGVSTADSRTAGDGWFEDSTTTVTDHLLKGASEARRTWSSVITEFTDMVPAGKRLPANKVALVPSSLVDDDTHVHNFLAFALASRSERGQGAALTVTLVTTTRAQRGARLITENLFQLSAGALLILVAWHVSRGPAAPTRSNDSD